MKNYRYDLTGSAIAPPPGKLIDYFQNLVNRPDWLEYISKNCKGPAMPTLPVTTCNIVQPYHDNYCDCCRNHWSIVIGTQGFAGIYTAFLVAITKIEIGPIDRIARVSGYVYPDLKNITTITSGFYASYIGCFFKLN